MKDIALWSIGAYFAIGVIVTVTLVGTTRGEEGNGWGLVVLFWPVILLALLWERGDD